MNVGSPVGDKGPLEAVIDFSDDVELQFDVKEVVLKCRAGDILTDCVGICR